MSQSQGISLASSNFFFPIHTHSLTHFLALFHTHSLSHFLSHSFLIFLCFKKLGYFSISPVSLSLSNTHSLLHTQTLSLKNTLFHHNLTVSHTYTLSHFLSHSTVCHKVRVFQYLPVSLSHIHTHSISLSFALSHSLSLALTHTHSLTPLWSICMTQSQGI